MMCLHVVCQIERFPGALDRRSDFVEKLRCFPPRKLTITGNLVGSDCSAVTAGSISSSSLGQLEISSMARSFVFQMLFSF